MPHRIAVHGLAAALVNEPERAVEWQHFLLAGEHDAVPVRKRAVENHVAHKERGTATMLVHGCGVDAEYHLPRGIVRMQGRGGVHIVGEVG